MTLVYVVGGVSFDRYLSGFMLRYEHGLLLNVLREQGGFMRQVDGRGI